MQISRNLQAYALFPWFVIFNVQKPHVFVFMIRKYFM